MPVYAFYVFDRSCTCVFYASYAGKPPRPGTTTLPNVYRSSLPNGTDSVRSSAAQMPPWDRFSATTAGTAAGDRNSGAATTGNGTANGSRTGEGNGNGNGTVKTEGTGLAFDEEAKLVYGIILSLRNMVKKLSGRYVSPSPSTPYPLETKMQDPNSSLALPPLRRDEDSFHSFSTTSYKLHYLHTPTSLHFVLLTSPMVESLRFVLRQIYTGAFTDFVVRNPFINTDSRIAGRGIDNEAFRSAVERFLMSL